MPQTDAVAAPGPRAGPGSGAVPPGRRAAAGRLKSAGAALARYAGVLPFAAYVTLGLLIPVVAIIVGAFQAPGTGAFTTAAMTPGAAVAVSLPAVPVLVTPRRATGDAPVLAG